MLVKRQHEDAEDYDAILDEAVREHKRRVFVKKVIKTLAIAALISVVLYSTVSITEKPSELRAESETQEQK